MLTELIGKKMMYSLMANAAAELSVGCSEMNEDVIFSAFTKVCAYGMDLDLKPSPEAIKSVIQEVFDKMGPQKEEAFEKEKENEDNSGTEL